MGKILSTVLLALILGACQSAPTKIYSSRTFDKKDLAASLRRPIEVTAKTQIIDARGPLQTGLSKVSGAQVIHWRDYTRRVGQSSGTLISDLDSLAKRLALKGLRPDQPTLVLGDGQQGQGEEGRVAWMLMYLGFEDVQTLHVDAMKTLGRTKGEEPPVKNEKAWRPNVQLKLLAEAKEVIAHALGKKPRKMHLIDVRSSKEYFARDAKTESYLDPDLRAINIPWTQFFTEEGRPFALMTEQLQSVGIERGDRIVVISQEGVRSAAVTYALTMMGYTNVGNFAAGWKSLK